MNPQQPPKAPIPMSTFKELLEKAVPDHRTPRCYSDAAREQYIARLNPATMKLVLEALEHSLGVIKLAKVAEAYRHTDSDEAVKRFSNNHADVKKIEAALHALNTPSHE